MSLFGVDYPIAGRVKIYACWSRHSGGGLAMVSLVAEIEEGPADTNCRAEQYPQVQFAGRCGGGVSKPRLLQDGDGTDDRTGWPAVIRGRRGSTGKCSSQDPAVK